MEAWVTDHWQTSQAWEFNGTPVAPGDGVRVKGSQSRWTFLEHGKNTQTGAEWIDLLKVAEGESLHFRAVALDLVAGVTPSADMQPAA